MPESDLVDSWFPADLPSPRDWEDRYPHRGLPPGAEVTRFAPSPTGSLHLGGVYVATLARDLAHRTGGAYLVRIEDTDQTRQVAGAAEDFDRLFAHLGLTPDEADPDGRYGPYRQSDRERIYLSYARELLRRGRAYPCFCPPEALARAAEEQRGSRSPLGYYGRWAACRNLDPAEADRRVRAGEPYVVRFRCPQGIPGRVRFADRVRGAVTMLDNGNDAVVLKSEADGHRLPTYHFAHVVDDHLMRVTLVVRGDEWLSSLPLHRQLHEALDFEPPAYAHVSPLMKVDGASRRKLSKRKDPESAAAFYLAAGYPVEALQHYLRGLANSRLSDLPTEKALAEPVRLAEIGTAGPMVDAAKLRSISREYISTLTPEEVLAAVLAWAAAHDRAFHRLLDGHREAALAAARIAQFGTGSPRKELACWSDFRQAYGFLLPGGQVPVAGPEDRAFGGLDPRLVRALARDFTASYRHDTDPDRWFDQLRELAERHGFARSVAALRQAPDAHPGSVRDVANVVRLCLTGRSQSPDLFQIVRALGADEVVARFGPLL
ncbi:glutamate--tRNA ligase [Streptomyces sp. NPDC092296]|uniref:glutamate--tRNA ligase n=1 Tax=Streptomyces sp. NPDC092296 TaxID=3366012 RepID=UPI00381C6575